MMCEIISVVDNLKFASPSCLKKSNKLLIDLPMRPVKGDMIEDVNRSVWIVAGVGIVLIDHASKYSYKSDPSYRTRIKVYVTPSV